MKWQGLKKVLKLHGSADRNYCTGCQRFYDLEAFLALKGLFRVAWTVARWSSRM